MKAAASRLAKRIECQEGASKTIRDEQRRVKKIEVALEVLPRNNSTQLLGTSGLQVDQLRTVREATTTRAV